MTTATKPRFWTCKCPRQWYPRAEYCPHCLQRRDEPTEEERKEELRAKLRSAHKNFDWSPDGMQNSDRPSAVWIHEDDVVAFAAKCVADALAQLRTIVTVLVLALVTFCAGCDPAPLSMRDSGVAAVDTGAEAALGGVPVPVDGRRMRELQKRILRAVNNERKS